MKLNRKANGKENFTELSLKNISTLGNNSRLRTSSDNLLSRSEETTVEKSKILLVLFSSWEALSKFMSTNYSIRMARRGGGKSQTNLHAGSETRVLKNESPVGVIISIFCVGTDL